MAGQIEESVKAVRLSEILAFQNEVTERKNKQLKGTLQEILLEGRDSRGTGKLTGRTRTNKIVNIALPADGIVRDFVTVRITRAYRHSLEGELETS
ncbi:MAG: TRAM domain-containing protein [Desulfobacterales bacterium]|nr:TRAM domain-containing protein [Desulfobacterales bacterium]